MGLDQYLYKKKLYLDGEMTRLKDDIKEVEKKMPKLLPAIFGNSMDVIYDLIDGDGVIESTEKLVMTWRKANAIHKWFVDNMEGANDYEDDCSDREVSVKQLKSLLALCEEVLEKTKTKPGKIHTGTIMRDGKSIEQFEDGEVIENPEVAAELLPTTEGFFFGSTDYDQYYLQDIRRTAEHLRIILDQADDENWRESFIYKSSW